MGKKGGGKKLLDTANKWVARDSKSFLKVDHLLKLALWATGEASIPSLSAFFGRQYAAAGEVSGISPDPSLFSCQRCETILQPGLNCTVRIEKTSAKARRRRKKTCTSLQNNVVYNCHFCSHKNLKRGTPKGHMKEICPSKAKQKPPKPRHPKSASSEKARGSEEAVLPPTTAETSVTDAPTTPSLRSCTTLLDAKKRKRNRSGSKRPEGSESTNAANKDEKTVGQSSKRRKSWMSLKAITESKEHGGSKNFSNLSIPFFM
ncbi:hypothetical protein M5689_010758 [Euphorbia peplus]|nr:hypothetical protein M5689_010758 [Euphorbia peplus]